MPLAEDTLHTPTLGRRLLPWLLGLALLALVVWAALSLRGWLGQDTQPQRQVARITVLPDTPPPPPPPPPKELPQPTPRDAPQAAPQPAPQPVQAPPADAPIKMEGAAGSGDSAFGAGTVTNDYRGGAPTVGGTGGGGIGQAIDRAGHRLYAQGLRQQLQAEMERRLRGEATRLSGDFSLWLLPDGTLQRWELADVADAQADADLRAALQDSLAAGVRFAPPPAGLVQPLRFRLSVKPAG